MSYRALSAAGTVSFLTSPNKMRTRANGRSVYHRNKQRFTIASVRTKKCFFSFLSYHVHLPLHIPSCDKPIISWIRQTALVAFAHD